ncbi:MAG: AMP-binding protein [Bacteroidota bacterium]
MAEPFNIVDLFYESARKRPGKTALICKDRKTTFAELEAQVSGTAAYFLKRGIAKGDRVLIFVPMSPDLYRIVLALFRIGATAVFLDEWVGKKRMEECCKVAQCKAFIGIFKARLLSWFSSELRKIPLKLSTAYTPLPFGRFPETSADDTALITFTTGSTGTPKAAKRTHGFLHAQFRALIRKTGADQQEIDMPVLPIVLLLNLGSGITSVIADFKASRPESLRPERIIGQIEQYGVSRIIASPYFVRELSRTMIRNGKKLPGVAKIFTGGAPVFPAEAELYVRAFPSAHVEVVYGSTEAEPISSISAQELILERTAALKRGLKAGKPDPSARVRIIGISGLDISVASAGELERLSLAPGHIGEIIVSGDHVLREYFNNEEALKRNKIFIGDSCWHRTGDSGYLDQDGTLFLTGRCSMLINKNGTLISPFVYENYFQTIEGVELGTLLDCRGKLCAIVQIGKAFSRKQIGKAIKAQAPDIEEIVFLDRIPRDPRHNSKIDYARLKERLYARL